MAIIGRILLMPKGTYNGSTVYNHLDWVRYNGSAWVCKVDGTVGIVPTEGDNWTVLAQDGNVGGSVDWSNVNYKPFDALAVDGGLTTDGSNNLLIDLSFLTGSNISYDNSSSGLSANTIQLAIDELAGSMGGSTVAWNQIQTSTGATKIAEITINGTKTDVYSPSGGGGGASKLDDLSDVSIDTVTLDDGQILAYNLSDQEFQNVDMPTGGHTMTPLPSSDPDESDVVNAVNGALLEGGTNDKVMSAYGVGVWSNVKEYTLVAHVDAGDDTVGVWNDGWESENPKDRTGWIYHECLYHMLSSNDVKYEIDFDVKSGDSVGWYAHRIDDEVTITVTEGGETVTKNVGCIAIKLLNPVQTVGGIDVAVDVRINRTETVNSVVPAP